MKTTKILALLVVTLMLCIVFASCVKQTTESVHQHTIVIDEAVAPTCMSTGLTSGAHCSDCGEILVTQQVLPAIDDHRFIGCVCEICGELKDSEGLAYAVIDSETCYISGIGSCTDININIPEYIDGHKVTSINDYAFHGCSSLTSVFIPDSVTSIGVGAFAYCNSLGNITVEEGNTVYHSAGNSIIETASKTLIAGCKNSIIPTDGSVTSIGEWAFEYCSSLTSIVIPDGVTSIDEGAFFACKDLASVIIGDSVTSIGKGAFSNCSSLVSIIIPDCVTSIGDNAFFNCKSLTSVVIGDSIAIIGNETFEGCSSLTSIVIPYSVTSISAFALSYCSSLESIEFEGTKAQWNAISKGSEWDTYTGNYVVYCTDGDIAKQ